MSPWQGLGGTISSCGVPGRTSDWLEVEGKWPALAGALGDKRGDKRDWQKPQALLEGGPAAGTGGLREARRGDHELQCCRGL